MIKKNQNNKMELPKIILWGGGSMARVIQSMVEESKSGDVEIIFDDTLEATSFESPAKFVNNANTLKGIIKSVTHYIVCIGNEHGYARVKTAEHLQKIGLKDMAIIHERSFIDPTSIIGRGCQIMPFALVHKFSEIGSYTIINTSATIDHECKIGNGVHIMGSAALSGRVEVGDFATIGTNATILPSIKIGEGAYVGAGSVVTKDVDSYSVVAGVPAKKIKKNRVIFFEESIKLVTD